MNINIYYGGRGLIEDPTLYVLKKMEHVFDELRVKVNRYNLFELKNELTTLPQTLKNADGVILAASVEWLGIGGYMQQFLDACWLYGDKDKISSLYMAPVVVATTYGEKEAYETMVNAWELLSGRPCQGVCAYVDDSVDFEMNRQYGELIEKRTENLYRAISQKPIHFPSSYHAIKQSILKTSLDLTPQESEQLSKFVSDDVYVQKQKEDIEELATMFKGMLNQQALVSDGEFIKEFQNCFIKQDSLIASFLFYIENAKKPLLVEINQEELACRYEKKDSVDVVAKLSNDVMRSIVTGRISFQRAFMTGEMTAKGDFKTLRLLDQVFVFN